MDDRYQFQPWYIRLWRRRHYLPIPWVALRIKLRHPDDHWDMAWSLAKGLAQCRMKWTHTWAELHFEEDDE
jgi:hypothetical protein